jgi:chemotaxis signal transduction protein
MTTEMLIVTIGGRRCAVPMESVIEVRVHEGATRIPGAPVWVCGVTERHGAPVHVVDAARRLELGALTPDERNCLVFVERGALLVDGVDGIVEGAGDAVLVDVDEVFGGVA